MRGSLLDRFMIKYTPEPNSGCWLWTAGWSRGIGYGQIIRKKNGKWQSAWAHRISWELFRGDIPNDLFVLHKCDVRLCVNPDHLFLGTQSDNVADMVKKGRQARGDSHGSYTMPNKWARGESQGSSKLTEELVRLARHRHHNGETFQSIADDMEVARSTISRAVYGKQWSHVR